MKLRGKNIFRERKEKERNVPELGYFINHNRNSVEPCIVVFGKVAIKPISNETDIFGYKTQLAAYLWEEKKPQMSHSIIIMEIFNVKQ